MAQGRADVVFDREGARELWRYALAVLKEWQSTPIWQPAQQLRAATFSNARDYAGRFLLELLQNGHDAHPGDQSDGRVHILLDEDEGPYGTLYVANGGTPFTWQRVEAVCKLARSEKTVGEGIGNKGVGFRSVLEITQAPEIYSARSSGPGQSCLDGYRFRFAVEDDLRVLLRDDELARKAAKELPPLQVPFPISDLPAICEELGADGHVTVVRLPLRSEAAGHEAARRLKELATAKAPVMLFLDRLERLVLERRGANGVIDRTELTRQEQPFDSAEVGASGQVESDGSVPVVSLAHVVLGSLGRFLVARGHVPVERLHNTIAAAAQLGRLDESWLDWTEPAVVEIALPLRLEISRRGHVYTFLPLGDDVAAPLRGHLNAPFFTKMDRTALDREHPLNMMLFDALAETCLVASARLRKRAATDARRLAIDLISWEPEAQSAGLLLAAARRVHDCEFSDVSLVPVLGGIAPQTVWSAPRDAVLWPADDLAVLTAQAAESVGVVVADPDVGDNRLRRLAKVCEWLKCPLEPSAQEQADHVERIVGALPLPAPGDPLDVWNGVYTDLVRLFTDQGRILQGRKLLLADDGTLRRCNGGAESGNEVEKPRRKSRREAFFQPTRVEADSTDELAVPETLQKRLFYLHHGLQWVDDEGHIRRQEARLFLERFGLVRRFDSAGLLEHVRNALEESSAKKLRLQALKFVFRLHRSRRSSQSLQIRSLGLYVPSAAGPLVLAHQAAFGTGWSGTKGDDLVSVVAEGREAASDLKWIENRLVAPPHELVGRGDTQEEWREFLKALGVTDGLIPVISSGAVNTAYGSELDTAGIIRMAKTPRGVTEQWQPYIERSGRSARHPYTPYEGTPAFRLPGQDVAGGFSEQGRLAYARLVLHGLANWSEKYFTSVWTRARPGDQNPQHVLTPMAAFIREQAWLPVRGHRRPVAFARPTDAWHCPSSIEEEPPFARTIAHGIRPLLESETTLNRLRAMGLPTWGDPRDSARLIAALGDLVDSGAVGPEDRPALQRTNERAWEGLTKYADTLFDRAYALKPLTDAAILAEAGEQLSTVEVADLRQGIKTLYITGERDSLTARLIRELEHALLVVPGRARQAAQLLAHVCPGAIRHVDNAALDVKVDGQPIDPPALGSPLLDHVPWLPLAVGVLADHPSHGLRPTEAALTDLVAVARRIRIHSYVSLDMTLDNEPVVLPDRQGGILPLPDTHHPLILTPAAPEAGLDWEALAQLSDAIGHVVGRPEFALHLRVAAHELRLTHATLTSPAEQQLADALGVSVQQVGETRRRLDGSISGVLERCYPLLVHSLGMAVARELTDPPPVDVRTFHTLLMRYNDELPLPAERLIPAARNARDIDELRAEAGLDFAEFNRTLAELAPGYYPVSRAEVHEEAMREYVDLHRSHLVDRLRWAVQGHFDAREPVTGWPESRSLQWITAPESWALTRDSVNAELLRLHVEEALTVHMGAPAPQHGERLPALDRLRSRNSTVVHGLAAEIVALIKAAGRPLPEALAGTNPTADVTALLDQSGALDFRDLAKDDVVAWLEALGQWPTGMPTTTDLTAHGLTSTDLDRERQAAEHAREERARQQRIISIGNQEFDIGSGDFTQMVAELQRALQANPELIAGRNRFAALQRPLVRKVPPAPSSRMGRYAGSDRGLSSAQRTAIGFVGEWFAYQWLRERYPTADESSWVSTNRQNVFPGSLGDDGLGFDFSVGSGKQPLMFEVKATQGDGGQLELGESEVRAAQRFAGSDRWRILAITSVLDPERLTVTMLPNPFSARGRGVYREEGGALRFSYRL